MKHYRKQDDEHVVAEIKPILDSRPTYGYKRITAMVNRLRSSKGLHRYNKKRIYRVMKLNGLLLPQSGKIKTHRPTGKVMTLHSNTRWCSDCFEIKCFNGEKVYVSFALDSHDREILSYIAKSSPLHSEDIQLLMLKSVENRFGNNNAPRLIEFLSDRGAIYRASNVQSFGRSLNLKSCFTAAYSPESNGMSESFVKTIKRDYVYMNDCSTAKKTIKMLSNWIKDYNEIAPHSALAMRSPKEFLLSKIG